MQRFSYVRPGSLAECFEVLEEHGAGAKILAGGTDLVVGLQNRRFGPRVVVDVKWMSDLRAGIEQVGDRLVVSALTPMSDIIADPRVQQHFPALAEAAVTVGSVQIRNRATLTGNICNASPAADTAPALLAHDAEVVLVSRAGRRLVPLDEFVLGPRVTALRVGEVAAAIEIPIPTAPLGARFSRLTRRRGVDLATISLCCTVGPVVTRIAYGAVAPRPFLVSDRSGVLADPAADPDERERVLAELVSHATPITDIRAGAGYRAAMLLVHSRRALAIAIERRDHPGEEAHGA
jgi:CO/xanthine dehydrogenase FAD-binding subunit